MSIKISEENSVPNFRSSVWYVSSNVSEVITASFFQDVDRKLGTNVSEEHVISIFRVNK
jgi:hypothetical protein